jgi:hypothetical protein
MMFNTLVERVEKDFSEMPGLEVTMAPGRPPLEHRRRRLPLRHRRPGGRWLPEVDDEAYGHPHRSGAVDGKGRRELSYKSVQRPHPRHRIVAFYRTAGLRYFCAASFFICSTALATL